jgi:hypothetical protein
VGGWYDVSGLIEQGGWILYPVIPIFNLFFIFAGLLHNLILSFTLLIAALIPIK